MVNFEIIVRNLLHEMGDPPPVVPAPEKTPSPEETKTPEQIEEEIAKTLSQYLIKNQGENIRTKFNDVFKNYYASGAGMFPDNNTFESLIYIVSKNSIRDTENLGPFERDLPSFFPLVDLIALVKQTYTEVKGKPEEKQSAAEAVVQTFLKRMDEFKKTNRQMPLEFPALSPWAISVRDRYYEKQGRVDIGKFKIENPEIQNKSIREAIMIFLEHRRTSKIKLFKKEISIGSAENDINAILENPNKYIRGKISFPDKKINLLYHGATPDLILSVAQNAFALFEQQRLEKNIVEGNNIPELYKNFLDGNVVEFAVKKEKENEEEIGSTGRAMVGFGESVTFNDVIGTLFEELETSFPNGSYKIKDIREFASVPQSAQLLKSLKALADYIKTEAQRIDWSEKVASVASAGTDAAVGARLGAKMLGP